MSILKTLMKIMNNLSNYRPVLSYRDMFCPSVQLFEGVFSPHHFKFSVGQWDCFVKQFNGLLQIASLHLENKRLNSCFRHILCIHLQYTGWFI